MNTHLVTAEDASLPPGETIAGVPGVPILSMKGVTKRFVGTLALDGVDLSVRRGEIHALVGQNGAGKSTLVKILAGDYTATSGTIQIDGKPVAIHNTRDAHRLGIGIVYQELSLLPNLTVAENIFLGREPGHTGAHPGYIDRRALLSGARDVLAGLGLPIDPRAKVAWLSLPERQLVEIAKVLALRPRILILDEPTAALPQADAERLFGLLAGLKQQDIGIIYITHRFKEVLQLCDRGTVLRNGRVVHVFDVATTTLHGLVEATLGQQSSTFYRRTHTRRDTSLSHDEEKESDPPPAVAVRDLCVGEKIAGVSFEVRRGDIVGICGLLGAGQNELARCLFGDQSEAHGTIEIHGRPLAIVSPRAARHAGIGFLSDSRREEGIVPDMRVRENISIASLRRVTWARLAPFINSRVERRLSVEAAARTNVQPGALPRPIRFLSGGNQQKAILARWLMHDADIFVFVEPTRGVDVGAKNEIYTRLETLAQEGKTVIVVSTDIAEILGLSDRILVMHQGRLAAMLDGRDATEEQVALAMQGGYTNVD